MAKISRKALLIGAAALALGVGAYAYSQQDEPKKKKPGNGDPKPNGNGDGGFKVGKLDTTSIVDERVMLEEDPEARFKYTSFFTPESEQIIISDLQGWRNKNNPTGACVWVTGFDPGEFGQGEFNDYMVEAREAAASVLQKRYPEGMWRPYTTEAGTPLKPSTGMSLQHPLWQRWLFQRVENIGKREVCSWGVPGT